MQSEESVTSFGVSELDHAQLWILAVLFFGIGDVVTTGVGLELAGVVEVHPVAAALFQQSTVATMVALKSIAFAGCYLLWRVAPSPSSVGVPLGLAVLGVTVTLWNSAIVLSVALS